jgi:hypothetical protein
LICQIKEQDQPSLEDIYNALQVFAKGLPTQEGCFIMHELFEQEARVKKEWFSHNPNKRGL